MPNNAWDAAEMSSCNSEDCTELLYGGMFSDYSGMLLFGEFI
jgi:hypothetical protein